MIKRRLGARVITGIVMLGLAVVARADEPKVKKPKVKAPTSPILRWTMSPACIPQTSCYILGENLPTGAMVKITDASGTTSDASVTLRGDWAYGLSVPKTADGTYTVGLYSDGKLVTNEITMVVVKANVSKFTDGKNWHEDRSDLDGDGRPTVGSSSNNVQGDDCDDTDRTRWPGNPEVEDTKFHDEDCDPTTVASSLGTGDADGDGLISWEHCNVTIESKKVVWRCGTDCDDSSYAIGIGSQKCSASDSDEVFVCAPPKPDQKVKATALATYDASPFSTASPWVKKSCPKGTKCVAQPNGTGVCH